MVVSYKTPYHNNRLIFTITPYMIMGERSRVLFGGIS